MAVEQENRAAEQVREEVRARYAAAARAVSAARGGCCGSQAAPVPSTVDKRRADGGPDDPFGAAQYDEADRAVLPEAAVEASLGCGNPLLVADLREGDTVLDLGSGGGIDVLLSARRVGATGRAYGLDMTDEMLELARRNAAAAGTSNVEFLKGQIEAIPLPDATVDVVISNCVINLSTDKPTVFAETFRVLRPGGRLGVSDVVAGNELTPEQRAERGAWAACVAGALSMDEYRAGLAAAGFTDIDITPTHEAADGMYSAIIKATKP